MKPVSRSWECEIYVEKQLPADLRARAAQRGRTLWWRAGDALEVLDWYRRRRIAILGVDLAYDAGEATQATLVVYDASDLFSRFRTGELDWPQVVESTEEGANAFVVEHQDEPDALFDITAETRDGHLACG